MMRQPVMRFLIALVVILALGTLLIARPPVASANPDLQSGNLLQNPSFEEPFIQYVWDDGSGFVAEHWNPWYYNDDGPEYDTPEFKQATVAIDPYRVRSGENAQQYFKDWARHLAGLYQVVDVPANSKLRFTIYGHAWSSFCDTQNQGSKKDPICDPRDSNKGDGINPISMKIGIDPTGGTDPFNPNIVWSQPTGVYDDWDLFEIETTAKGSKVSVWVYSTPKYGSAKINVYWDDAALTTGGSGSGSSATSTPKPGGTSSGTTTATPKVTGTPGTPTPKPTTKPGGLPPVQPQPPEPDGAQYHVVQPGETLFGISLTYDVSVDQLMAQNGLTNGNQIYVGQRLLIHAAPPTQPPTPTSDATSTPTPAPTEVAEVPAAQICTALFEDFNVDGLRQDDEPLLAGGTMKISGESNDTYTTDGVSEPFCFGPLLSGNYLVDVAPPDGYDLSSVSQMPLTLSEGSEITLSFGAVAIEEDTGEEEAVEEPEAAAPAAIPRSTLLIGAAALGALLLLGGVVAVVTLFTRKRPAEADSEDDEEAASE